MDILLIDYVAQHALLESCRYQVYKGLSEKQFMLLLSRPHGVSRKKLKLLILFPGVTE